MDDNVRVPKLAQQIQSQLQNLEESYLNLQSTAEQIRVNITVCKLSFQLLLYLALIDRNIWWYMVSIPVYCLFWQKYTIFQENLLNDLYTGCFISTWWIQSIAICVVISLVNTQQFSESLYGRLQHIMQQDGQKVAQIKSPM